MKKIKVNTNTPDGFRKAIISFIVKYGDKHITKRAIDWLKSITFKDLNYHQGDLIHVILNDQNKILGVIAIAKYGLEQAIIVVVPAARKKGIGVQLTEGVLADLDRCYVKVANDNIPSLKLCFSVGMKAFDLIRGPTGKPTLVLGLGNFDPVEWNNRKRRE